MTFFSRARPVANEDWSRFVAVLFGLTTPIVIVTAVDPYSLIENPTVFEVCMIGVSFACLAAYVANVLFPGNVQHVWLDNENRVVELVCRGICSSSVTPIPLDAIDRALSAHAQSDLADLRIPALLLKSGQAIRLPEGMTDGEIDAINSAIQQGLKSLPKQTEI